MDLFLTQVVPITIGLLAFLCALYLPLERSRQVAPTSREWLVLAGALPATCLTAIASLSVTGTIAAIGLFYLLVLPGCFAALAGRRVFLWSLVLWMVAWLSVPLYVSRYGFTPFPLSSIDSLGFRCFVLAMATFGSQIFTAGVWTILHFRHKHAPRS